MDTNRLDKLEQLFTQRILETEFRVNVLERFLMILAEKRPDLMDAKDLETARKQAQEDLNKKYPFAGIKVS